MIRLMPRSLPVNLWLRQSFTRRHGAVSPDYDCRAIPTGVATIGEQETRSDDEPLMYKGLKQARKRGSLQVFKKIKNRGSHHTLHWRTPAGQVSWEHHRKPQSSTSEMTRRRTPVRVKIEPHNDESNRGPPCSYSSCRQGPPQQHITPNFLMTPTNNPSNDAPACPLNTFRP
jgi:hypothetical protein